MIGELKKENGSPLFKYDNFKLVRMDKKVGEDIAAHSHPEALIFFTLLDGEVEVKLNEEESHILKQGYVLHFDGNNSISVKILKDAKIQVVLLNK